MVYRDIRQGQKTASVVYIVSRLLLIDDPLPGSRCWYAYSVSCSVLAHSSRPLQRAFRACLERIGCRGCRLALCLSGAGPLRSAGSTVERLNGLCVERVTAVSVVPLCPL